MFQRLLDDLLAIVHRSERRSDATENDKGAVPAATRSALCTDAAAGCLSLPPEGPVRAVFSGRSIRLGPDAMSAHGSGCAFPVYTYLILCAVAVEYNIYYLRYFSICGTTIRYIT